MFLNMKMKWVLAPALAILLAAAVFVPGAAAQDDEAMPPQAVAEAGHDSGSEEIYTAAPTDDTHPIIRLTSEKSEIVRLERDVKSLIVGNPAHLSVLMDNTRTLVLVPQMPGATHFTVLDEAGKVIMQRHVIVGPGMPEKKIVRVRRSCINAGGGTCQDTSVYYCPDSCHAVAPAAGGQDPGSMAGLFSGLMGGGSSSGGGGSLSDDASPVPASPSTGIPGLDDLMDQLRQGMQENLGTPAESE